MKKNYILIILFIYSVCATGGMFVLSKKLHKAEVCNKAFVLWFKHNLGIQVDLDKLYEDGVKWVNDQKYQ